MTYQILDRSRVRIWSVTLLITVAAAAAGLGAWKLSSVQRAEAAAANQPEQAEVVTAATATQREYQDVTTSIGTVLATRSVTLRNELPGTVRFARLVPGRIVDAGSVLVALDVSVEKAELKALQAQAQLAETTLARVERLRERQAVSAIELDNARAERDVAVAQIARIEAIIERKVIRAPFRARVGMADVHPGQFLDAGTLLTTLQGVDEAAHVDFAVAQAVAAELRAGDVVEVLTGPDETDVTAARIVAVDARVDPATRSAMVRARIDGAAVSPGASVRVRVPVGEPRSVVAIPVSALRKGPGGDYAYVLEVTERGETRARERQVAAGPVIGDEVVVLGGLEAGERVAASGSFKLREGALVQLTGDTLAQTRAGR